MIDICRLCHEKKQMTFEHVPPRITFNKTTRYKEISLIDYFQNEEPLGNKFKGKTKQGGIGYYSLCKDCNSYLGQNYVPAFNSYSNSFIELVERKVGNYFELEMHDFEVLKVLKQTIAMFLAMNNANFSINNKELADFVMDGGCNELSAKYRIFIYLNNEGNLRNIPLMISGNFETGLSVAATEITFPPLGHVLTIGFNGSLPFHHEITMFKNATIEDRRSEVFKLFKLPTHHPVLLDYRSLEEIRKSI